MRQWPQFNIGVVALLAVLLAGGSVYLLEPLPLQILRNAVFDQYQRWHPRAYQAAPVRIIDIDDDSLKQLGQWPWPRTRVAELVNRLQAAGALAIAFDVIFAEEDRTSPKAMMTIWNLSDDTRERLTQIPDHDDVLAKTLRDGRVILGFALEREGPENFLQARPFRVVNSGESPLPFLHEFSSALPSIPLLADAAAGNGALSFVPDADGVVRRVPVVVRLRNEIMPTLSAESLRVAQGARNYVVKTAAEKGAGLQEVRIGSITVPTTPRGEFWVYYTQPVSQRYVSAWKVLAGKVPAEQIAGHILLVGTSAKGLMDLRFSPMGTIIPGVEVHAQALEQMLTGKYLQRPAWAAAIEVLVILLGGLLLGILTLASGALISATVTAVAITATGWGTWSAFTNHGLLLDPVTPAIALLVTFIVTSIVRHVSSERRQRWVREAFSRYVSPNLVSHLMNNPGQLELGGRRQECSFIFTDLQGFTSLMEKADPAKAVSLLNVYLDRMIAIAFSYGGTLDRIVGDAVAIMFSAPVAQPDHRLRALQCALEMDAFAVHYAEELNAKGIAFGLTRIGIHTGEVIVGNFGGTTIFDYRALGDPVNTASRLESVNKHLGTRICVSEATLSGCPDAVVRPLGRLVLVGKSQPIMVYEPIIPADGSKPQFDTLYQTAFELLRQQNSQARSAFEDLAKERPQDPLVQLHLQRLCAGEEGDMIVMAEK